MSWRLLLDQLFYCKFLCKFFFWLIWLRGGSLSYLWDLINNTQLVTFLPLMALGHPGYVLSFFAKLNFITEDILLDDPERSIQTKYVRTYSDWNKNLDPQDMLFNFMYNNPFIFFIFVGISGIAILLAIFVCKSKR